MKRKQVFILIGILLVPIAIYLGSTAYSAAYPCVDDTGSHYAPRQGYSCAPQPMLLYVKSSSLYTNGTFEFLIISGGPATINQVSIMPNSSVPTTAFTPTNMTCNGLVPINHSPITETCTFSGQSFQVGQTYHWFLGTNAGYSWDGTVVAKTS
jgi:hypothetical protein